jgi:hypothetical protein
MSRDTANATQPVSKHNALKAEGESGDRSGFGEGPSVPPSTSLGTLPKQGTCQMGAVASGPVPRQSPSTGGPEFRQDLELYALLSFRRLRPVLPLRPPVPGSSPPPYVGGSGVATSFVLWEIECRPPFRGTGGPSPLSRGAPKGGICSTPVCRVAPTDRSRGRPGVHSMLASSTPLSPASETSALRGRTSIRGPPFLHPPSSSACTRRKPLACRASAGWPPSQVRRQLSQPLP